MSNHPGRAHGAEPDERAEAEAAKKEDLISYIFIGIEAVLVLALIALTIGKFNGAVSKETEVIVDILGLSRDMIMVVIVLRSLIGSFRVRLEFSEKLRRGNVVLSQPASAVTSQVQRASSSSVQMT